MKLTKRLKWDDIFIILSITFLATLTLFYGIRLIHFYRVEHKKVRIDTVPFSTYLIDNDNNLKQDSDNENIYYYTGNDINNYVVYSGILFRIVSIKDGYIKLVTDDVMTSLVMAYDDNSYDSTYVNTWLNDNFISYLNDKDKYLVKTNTCIDTLDDYDTNKCLKYNNDYYVGLLSIDEYLLADANNSYLNNNSYYWLSNNDTTGNYWYVYDKGGVSNKSKTEVTYHSYGVRPTITLGKDITLIGGSGTKDSPYVINQNSNKLLVNRSVGEYVNYGGYLWRIIGYDTDNNVKLVLSDNLDDLESFYNESNSTYNNSLIYNYLNETFYNSLTNKELVINHEWDNGFYNEDTLYDYKAISNDKVNAYVGLLNIGDLFIYDTDNIFLMTKYKDNMLYTIQNNKVFIDLITKALNIRPVIYLNGKVNVKGLGTINSPFEIEGE